MNHDYLITYRHEEPDGSSLAVGRLVEETDLVNAIVTARRFPFKKTDDSRTFALNAILVGPPRIGHPVWRPCLSCVFVGAKRV